MSIYLENKQAISVGDLITYGGKSGRIIFIIQDGQFSPDYLEKDWSYLKKGIGIQIDGGDLFCLEEPDEDLILKQKVER